MNKEPVIDEIHYVKPGFEFKLAYNNLVKNSMVSNLPIKLNYKAGTAVLVKEFGGFKLDKMGNARLKISYLYQ